MKLRKRLLSIALTFAMVMTMVAVPASAAESFTVSASSTTASNGATNVYLDIQVSNNPGFTAMGLNVYYKADVLTCTNINLNKDSANKNTAWKEFKESLENEGKQAPVESSNPDNTEGLSTERKAAGWKLASIAYATAEPFTADGTIGRLAFSVPADTESCGTAIEIELFKCTDANSSDIDLSAIQTKDGEITINGVAPTLQTLTLDKATVSVTGSGDAQTITAAVASAKGTDLVSKVNWSVTPAESGVSIDADGKITVANNAKSDSYTVTAAPKDGVLGSALSKTFAVTRAAEKAQSVTISGGVATVTLPAVPVKDGAFSDDTVALYYEEQGFTVSAVNQYGETMSAPNVTWSFNTAVGELQYRSTTTHEICTRSGDHAAHEECEAFRFILEDAAAGLEISENGHLLLTSSCGTGKAVVTATVDDVTASTEVEVVKADARAAVITISGGAAELVIPADGAEGVHADFAAAVQDQYKEAMADAAVTWSVSPAAAGVSIDNSGRLTVTNDAKNAVEASDSFTITAKCGDAVASTTITVKRAGSVAKSILLYKDDVPLDAPDTVTIPTGEEANRYSYSAVVLDQYSKPMVDAEATLTLSPASGTGVKFEDDTLYVAKNAEKDKSYTLTASYNGIQQSVTITVKDIAITAPTVKLAKEPTYGDKWSEIVTALEGGYAELNNSKVEGEFYVKNAETVPAAGDQPYEIWFRGSGYDVQATTGTVKIEKAPLTITAKDNSITFGDAPAHNGVTYAGFVNSEDENDLTGTLHYTYGDYTADSAVGTYPIVPAGQSSANYEITYRSGELTVSAKSLIDAMVGTIAAVTYNGTEQTPTVTVTDGSALTLGRNYTVSYSGNRNAGTGKATISGCGNYIGDVTRYFTINKAQLAIASADFADRTYNGTKVATVTGVTFTGLMNGETLELGTDYTAVGEFAQANIGDAVSASVTVTLRDTAKTENYTLAVTTKENAGTAKIDAVQTTLKLSAANAVYTGVAYDANNISKESNVETAPLYTYYADNDGAKGETLTGAPVNAGAYWVSGSIAASGNNSAVTSEAVRFQITSAALKITADEKSVVYGDAAPAYTASFDGFVNGEGASVVSGLTFDCGYAQYDDAGSYTITPVGATAANYRISFVPGKLTVAKKDVTLHWSDVSALYYDGTAKTVTADVAALNDDDVTVTVAGGTQTEIGSYTATATGLAGDKAKNYTISGSVTKDYEIKAALTSVTVTPATVTAEIDGLTIKLTGYYGKGETVSVKGGGTAAVDGKLTVNGVTYLVDDSGVSQLPDGLTITEKAAVVSSEVEGYSTSVSVSGLGAAAYQAIRKMAEENTAIASAEVSLKVIVKSYDAAAKRLTLELTPVVTCRNAAGEVIGEEQQTISVQGPVTITITLPSGMTVPVYALHGSEILDVTVSGGRASWTQSSFSEVILYTDDRSASVTFTKNDGSIVHKDYAPADIGTALPTDSKTGMTFGGWKFTVDGTELSGTYQTLTDELLNKLSSGTVVTAEPVFTTVSGNGSHTGGTSGPSRHLVSVAKSANGTVTVTPAGARKGDTVIVTAVPDKGYTLETLTVLDRSGRELRLTKRADGTFSFVMPDDTVTVKALFAAGTTRFVDVPESKYFYDAVLWAVENDVTGGTDATHFSPYASCTRGQLVTFLWRLAGEPAVKGAASFSDVAAGRYCEKSVAWAAKNGVVGGYADGTFRPDAAVTRQQAAAILWRFVKAQGMDVSVGEDTNILSFNDAFSISDYAFPALQWAVGAGVMQGNDNCLLPGDVCTRAQIVTFLYRTFQGK